MNRTYAENWKDKQFWSKKNKGRDIKTYNICKFIVSNQTQSTQPNCKHLSSPKEIAKKYLSRSNLTKCRHKLLGLAEIITVNSSRPKFLVGAIQAQIAFLCSFLSLIKQQDVFLFVPNSQFLVDVAIGNNPNKLDQKIVLVIILGK